MNALTASLCTKPILGVALWLASLCVANQALSDAKVDLSHKGQILNEEISIPMDEKYSLGLDFKFDSWSSYEAKGPAGSVKRASNAACRDVTKYELLSSEEKSDLGAEIILEVQVFTLSGELMSKMQFSSRCVEGWGDKTKWRSFGHLDLKKGKYRISISNLNPVKTMNSIETVMHLSGSGAGFQ